MGARLPPFLAHPIYHNLIIRVLATEAKETGMRGRDKFYYRDRLKKPVSKGNGKGIGYMVVCGIGMYCMGSNNSSFGSPHIHVDLKKKGNQKPKLPGQKPPSRR